MGSVSLTLNAAYSNSVSADYSASGFSLPQPSAWSDWSDWQKTGETDTKINYKRTRTRTVYENIAYSWSFSHGTSSASGSSGTHSFTGLYAGSKGVISASVTVTCSTKTETDTGTKSEDKPKPPPSTEGGGGSSSGGGTTTPTTKAAKAMMFAAAPATQASYTIGTASKQLTIYTKPTAFSWGFSGGTIEEVFHYYTWNNFLSYLAKMRSWSSQADHYDCYSAYEVEAHEVISASKYNPIADVCGADRVSGGVNGTVIRANLFTSLDWPS